MSSLRTVGFLAAFTTLASVHAHGVVSNIIVNGQSYQGYSPSFASQNPAPVVAGWSIPEDQDYGFVLPDHYTHPDIICHRGATPAQTSIEVPAGGTIQLQWNTWPDTHHGPIIDYLANCNGDCKTVDKTTLKFNKIDEKGLISWDAQPGYWATDEFLAAGKTWGVKIPEWVAEGEYVLRHELVGLHEGNRDNGAQNYPQCVSLRVTGTGTDALGGGVVGTELYTPGDPGVKVDIYDKLDGYVIPGPAVYGVVAGGGSGSGNGTGTGMMKGRRRRTWGAEVGREN